MPHVAFLIVLGIVASAAADGHSQPFRVNEIAMTALAAPVHEARLFQVGYQLAKLARHLVSIQYHRGLPVSNTLAGVQAGELVECRAQRFKLVVRVALVNPLALVAGAQCKLVQYN